MVRLNNIEWLCPLAPAGRNVSREMYVVKGLFSSIGAICSTQAVYITPPGMMLWNNDEAGIEWSNQ